MLETSADSRGQCLVKVLLEVVDMFDANGQPQTVIINDTGNGQCGSQVPAAQFFNSLRPGRNANVTNNRVW